jgi:MFS family permease
VAGIVVARYGAASAFALNGLSFLAVILALGCMNAHGLPSARHRGSVRAEITAGLHYVRSTPLVAMVLGLLLFVSLFLINHNVMVPLLARNTLHQGPHGFGLLMSALGTGAVLGALAMALWGHRPPLRLLLLAATASGVLTLCLSVVRRFPAALACLALLGLAQIVFMASCNSTLQAESPDHLRGRVMSLYAFVFAGIAPVGSLLMGSLAQGFGVSATYAVAGGLGLCCVSALAWAWAVRVRRPALAAPVTETVAAGAPS